MQANGGPGQPAIPRPIKAMPATRATFIATPVRSPPNNKCATSEGTISNARPVTAVAESSGWMR